MKNQASHTKRPRLWAACGWCPRSGWSIWLIRALPERLAGKVNEQLEAFAAQMREGLLAASVTIGLGVMGELIDAEVTEVAGPKGRHDADRAAYRHGSEAGKVTLGGRRDPGAPAPGAHRCRRRGAEREVRLESYDTFASVDLLADHMVASMLAGLSGRRYRRGAGTGRRDGRGGGVGDVAVARCRRRFITATAERLAEFRARPLDDRRWLICFVDGFDFAGHTMIGALGVTADGTKVPLGVVEGSTENKAVVRRPRSPGCATAAWTPARGCCSCSTAAKRWRRCATCSATGP